MGHVEFFNRPGIYGEPGGDYVDNARRFAFFVAGVLRGPAAGRAGAADSARP